MNHLAFHVSWIVFDLINLVSIQRILTIKISDLQTLILIGLKLLATTIFFVSSR